MTTGITGKPVPTNVRVRTFHGDKAVQIRSNGKIADVIDGKRGIAIHNRLNGARAVHADRPDHSRIYVERGRPGFVERPYSYRGHEYHRRTYYHHGHMYNHYYRHHMYRGTPLYIYSPVVYYPAGFYGWAYNPWYRPIVYTWGWGGDPWYGYYSGYFYPYSSYPSAAYWLTDFLLSSILQAEFQANQEAEIMASRPSAGDEGYAAISPEVKEEIANEVRNQLALENYEAQLTSQNQEPDPASSGIARMFNDGSSHVFVVGDPMDVVDASGRECALSGGDVLRLDARPDPGATAVDLMVLSSKGGQECQVASTVTIALSDVQEMQNQLRASIDDGLQKLQAQQGREGLPQAPPSAMSAASTVAFAQAAPPPDPGEAAQLAQQLTEADSAESEVVTQSQQESSLPEPLPLPPAPPAITQGQTMEQVITALGQPSTVIDLGTKKVLQYPDRKVTLKDGKVVAVE